MYCLPIDCASTIGLVLILGTILPAKSLTPEALGHCKTILQTLENGSPLSEISGMGPNGVLRIEANAEGKFPLCDLKPMFKKMGINYTRYVCA